MQEEIANRERDILQIDLDDLASVSCDDQRDVQLQLRVIVLRLGVR